MPFLLIGGQAVNAYGISRQTGDVDLLVQRSRKVRWEELLADYNDILQLLRLKDNDISEADLKDLCLKYADISLFEKLKGDSKDR